MSRDGRRTSDPLTEPNGSPEAAPRYQLWVHRTANDTNADFLAGPESKNGINFGSYNVGLIQAIPRDGADLSDTPGGADTITLTEYEWSPGAGAFIPTGNTYTASGAGAPVGVEFDARGRIMYFAVTGIAGGRSVSIYASGYELDHTL